MIGYFNTPWQKIGITFKSTLCHIIILTNFDSFANVQHFVPVIDSNNDVGTDVLHTSLIRERLWLDKVLDVVVNEHYVDHNVSWFAYHALKNTEALAAGMNTINALLPLFHESAKTVAMAFTQCHTSSSSAHKARQTTVVKVDQPLHALAKEIQWLRPDTYGETKFVILMGGSIHIEMAFLCVFRGLAGWWWVVQGYRRGQGHFFWKGWCYDWGKHVTRWAHQVTAAALYAPQRDTHTTAVNVLPFGEWCAEESQAHTRFLHWGKRWTRTIVQGAEFPTICWVLEQAIAPWMFALNHTHYARWLPVHIGDTAQLHDTHLDVYDQFVQCHFTAHKSAQVLSLIDLDQNHF